MKKITSILAAGGDVRQLYCARRLAADFDISVAGFDPECVPEGLSPDFSDLHRERFSCIVLPVPALDETGCINTPFSRKKLTAEEVCAAAEPDAIVFAGKVTDQLRKKFPGREIIDYTAREELSLRNAVPTAEGAVEIALSELPVTLSGLPVLIVGMGRIGTALSAILRGFGADVTAAVRSSVGAAKAAVAGVPVVSAKGIPGEFALVFNTAPELVFSREVLERFPKDTLFIDLASKPGGVDMKAAADLGLKVIWALGLPGRCAPVTAGNIVAETIAGILAERGLSS